MNKSRLQINQGAIPQTLRQPIQAQTPKLEALPKTFAKDTVKLRRNLIKSLGQYYRIK